jgi:hypothetical protein
MFRQALQVWHYQREQFRLSFRASLSPLMEKLRDFALRFRAHGGASVTQVHSRISKTGIKHGNEKTAVKGAFPEALAGFSARLAIRFVRGPIAPEKGEKK